MKFKLCFSCVFGHVHRLGHLGHSVLFGFKFGPSVFGKNPGYAVAAGKGDGVLLNIKGIPFVKARRFDPSICALLTSQFGNPVRPNWDVSRLLCPRLQERLKSIRPCTITWQFRFPSPPAFDS